MKQFLPLVLRPAWLARLVRTPVAPLTPTLVVPLPAKYRILFGPAMQFEGPACPEAVAHRVAEVQLALQGLVEQGLARSRHVYF